MKKDWNQLNTEEKNKTIRIIANIAFFISLLLPTMSVAELGSGDVYAKGGGLWQYSWGFLLWGTGMITLYCYIKEKAKQASTFSLINLILSIVVVLSIVLPYIQMAIEFGDMKLHFKLGMFLPILLAVIMLKPSLLQKNRTD